MPLKLPGVMLLPKASARKLSEIELVEVDGGRRKRPVPKAPYVVATYAAISKTCQSTCVFKDNGCFAQSGFIKRFTSKLDAQAEAHSLNGFDIAHNEAALIDRLWPQGVPQDGARGGRDMRIHIGGDASSEPAAMVLAAAAARYKRRGGGAVWTFTHNWRGIDVRAWDAPNGGPAIHAVASCESFAEVDDARARGYMASITMPSRQFGDGPRAYGVKPLGIDKTYRVIPCPNETKGIPCISCRLCLGYAEPKGVIGFKIHGVDFEKRSAEAAWKRKLPVVR